MWPEWVMLGPAGESCEVPTYLTKKLVCQFGRLGSAAPKETRADGKTKRAASKSSNSDGEDIPDMVCVI